MGGCYEINKIYEKIKTKSRNKSKNFLENIKSKYILNQVFQNISKIRLLDLVRFNKKFQKKQNVDINIFKEYSQKRTPIEIEIIPVKNKYGIFINNYTNENKIHYRIYFNKSKKEIKKNYFNEEDEVNKIKIRLDYQITSFQSLFYNCDCIESINFTKFYGKNISNMDSMFYMCTNLKELNFSNFKTDNVKNMNKMFSGCSSMKKIDLSNFNTNNVINMCEIHLM